MLNNILRIVSVSIVARELGPAEFGVAALAISASRLLLLFNQGGMGTYIVRFEGGPRRLREEASSAFWLNQVITVGQVLVLLAGIPVAQAVLDSNRLAGPIGVLGATFFIRQMSVVPEALARRSFNYRSLVVRDLISGVAASVLAVVLALRGAGVYAIVLPPLLIEPFRLLLLANLTSFKPGWNLGRARWRRIFAFSKHLIGGELVYLLLNDSDTLLIGAVLGAEAVGLYNLAWQLATLVGRNVVSIISDVSLPTFVAARRRGDLPDAVGKAIQVLGVLILPVQAILAACAALVIAVLYGPEFQGAGTLLCALAIFMGVRGVTSVSGPIFNVLGTPKTGLLLSLWTLPPYLITIVLASRHGVVAVAVGVALVRVVGGLWGLVMAIDKLEANRPALIGGLTRALPATFAAAGAAWTIQRFTSDLTALVQLVVAGFIGLAVAIVAQLLMNRPGVNQCRRMLSGR